MWRGTLRNARGETFSHRFCLVERGGVDEARAYLARYFAAMPGGVVEVEEVVSEEGKAGGDFVDGVDVVDGAVLTFTH